MRAEEFVAVRRDDWNRLEDLLARGGAGHLNALAPAQVLTMAALYRRATADVARAQRDWPDEPVHRYLNGLVGRGHGVRVAGDQLDSWGEQWVPVHDTGNGCNTKNHAYRLTLAPSPPVRVIQVAIASFDSDVVVQWDLIFAAAVIASLPIVLLFAFLQRYYVQGVVTSGLK